jgi:hypothetical protein
VSDVNQTCEQIRGQLAAYALGALDDEELAAVEAHLETCADCRELVREYEQSVHTLPSALAAVSATELPRSLKERVVQGVGDDARLHGQSPPRTRRWLRPAAALALATLAVAGLFVAWDARLEDARSQERELRARLAKLQGLQPIVLEVVDSRHTVRRVLLPPSERSESRAYGKVFTRTDLPDVVAMANRLPQPPAGQVYQLWATLAGRTRLIGRMPVDRHGFALLVFRAERPGARYDKVRVLLQRKGARRPSGRPVLVWTPES